MATKAYRIVSAKVPASLVEQLDRYIEQQRLVDILLTPSPAAIQTA
jgi:hypothetical protein